MEMLRENLEKKEMKLEELESKEVKSESKHSMENGVVSIFSGYDPVFLHYKIL